MGVRHDGLITSHKPGGAIAAYRLVRHGAADGTVVQSVAEATNSGTGGAAIIGVCTRVAAKSTDPGVEVVRSGIAEVEYGAAVARGDPLTSDGDGKAIPAAPGASKTQTIIGFAEMGGVSGDIGAVQISPGRFSKLP